MSHIAHTTSQRGYTLVEVLVAISILMIATVGPMTIASKGLQNAQLARQQTTAEFLAQEGVELVRYYRDWYTLQNLNGASSHTWDDFTAFVNSTSRCGNEAGCRVDLLNPSGVILRCVNTDCQMLQTEDGRVASRGAFSEAGQTGTPTEFTRTVYTTLSDSTEQLSVRSVVTWKTPNGATQSVELFTVLTDIYETLENL